MAQDQNYTVSYSTNVDASPGTKQVQSFADAVGNLIRAKADLTPVKGLLGKIREMSHNINLVINTSQPVATKNIKAKVEILTFSPF